MARLTQPLTLKLLRAYSEAALTNANELVQEASLLYANGHLARAYFLAVAAIEETGKGLLAFDAQGRNLADPRVSTALKRAMETHRDKIVAAFIGWLPVSLLSGEDNMSVVNSMIDLISGREPSMYTDIHPDGSKIQIPSERVRDAEARECVHRATDCLAHARILAKGSSPLLALDGVVASNKEGSWLDRYESNIPALTTTS
jgi:AbiV family abortive infection protein